MSRRDQITMTDEERAVFLAEGRTATLCTIGGDGFPHAAAMWYVLRDGLLHFSTYDRSQKTVNARRNPRCAVLVEAGDVYEELRGVMIRGTAEVPDDPGLTLDVQTGLYEKYTMPVTGLPADAVADALAQHAGKRVAVRVRPETVASWDHRKLGGVS